MVNEHVGWQQGLTLKRQKMTCTYQLSHSQRFSLIPHSLNATSPSSPSHRSIVIIGSLRGPLEGNALADSDSNRDIDTYRNRRERELKSFILDTVDRSSLNESDGQMEVA